MTNDLVLRDHPNYRHLTEPHTPSPKPEVEWLAPIKTDSCTLRNSKDAKYQVRKTARGYSLWNGLDCRLGHLRIRLIKDGFVSFADVQAWLRKQT